MNPIEQKYIQQDLSIIGSIVDRAALVRKYGTYSQRNPLLGKMRTCPHCGARRRESEQRCCTPILKRVNDNTIPRSLFKGKRKNPRLSRNRPPFFLIHQRLVEIERNPELMAAMGGEDGLSVKVERGIIRERRAVARSRGRMQKNSRRTNRSN